MHTLKTKIGSEIMCESLVQLKQIRAATETSKGSTYRKLGKVLRNQFPLHLDLSLHLRKLLLKIIIYMLITSFDFRTHLKPIEK